MKTTLAKQLAEALFRNGFGADTCALESMESIIDSELAGQRVKIEVSGGVAECIEQPDGIAVEIIDHDNACHE